jgi:hypothetical protein
VGSELQRTLGEVQIGVSMNDALQQTAIRFALLISGSWSSRCHCSKNRW